VPTWLSDSDHRIAEALFDTVLPGDGISPGAGEAGGADFIDQTLGAFSFEPPHIWAGGPFSGRRGGPGGFDQWLELGPVEELAWRIRIEGTQGRTEREFNGPVVGWQEMYRVGFDQLGADFLDLDAKERWIRFKTCDDEWRDLVFSHARQSLYGDPVYGGNRDESGWIAIGFDGDTQPTGWTNDQVTHPVDTPRMKKMIEGQS
jgi:hypothetical protein